MAVSGGQVQWRLPDGTLNAVLDTVEGGYTTGMAFDDRGHLFLTGFSTHKIYEFDTTGQLVGTFATLNGTTDCQPESLVFDAAGNLNVGQAGCSGDVLKFAPDGVGGDGEHRPYCTAHACRFRELPSGWPRPAHRHPSAGQSRAGLAPGSGQRGLVAGRVNV